LMTRLRKAVADGQICADADLDAVADALIGTLLLQALTQPGVGEDPKARFDGLLDAMLKGVANQTTDVKSGQ
jgi:hypothetical protein